MESVNNIIRKLSALVIVVIVSLWLSACSDSNQEQASATSEPSMVVEPLVATAAPVESISTAETYALPTPPLMKSRTGETFDPQTYSDHLILINVWATWCAPCRIEMPDLEELQAQYDPNQFQVIGIAADDADAVAEYLQTIKVTYPNYSGDPDQVFGWSQQLGNRVVAVPFSAIVDTTGAIRWTKMGGRILVEELEPIIEELINETPKKEG